MKNLVLLIACLVTLLVAGCSLPPERPITKEELYQTGIYNYYTIKESPESVLAAINRDGEVVLESSYKNQSVYIKILALTTGLKVYVSER